MARRMPDERAIRRWLIVAGASVVALGCTLMVLGLSDPAITGRDVFGLVLALVGLVTLILSVGRRP